jgi:predicted AlkP superfamily pyrophosphatase or phosphodiesterase
MNLSGKRPAPSHVATLSRLWSALAAAIVVGTWGTGCSEFQPSNPTVILVSLDAFRWDFLERAETPALDSLIARGVQAERLVPVFPTKTFPSHYSMATGLYPEHHGIVSNTMYDPAADAWFRLSDRVAVGDGRWWGGEPIWVTAERHGLVTAPYFWPGSEAEIRETRPTYWEPFDGSVTYAERVRQVLSWLDLPVQQRPSFVTLYVEAVDLIAHDYDPDGSAEVAAVIREVDEVVGLLVGGLRDRGMIDEVNIVVVSDHGMAQRSPDRVILIDDYVDLQQANVIDWDPVVMLRPDSESVADVYESLVDAHPHLKVYRRHEIPGRLHFRASERITPIVGIADVGWSISSRSYFERYPDRFVGGSHGYDPETGPMGSIFIAAGPAFKEGLTTPPFQSIHVYSLLCHILGLSAVPNDGAIDSVGFMLRR